MSRRKKRQVAQAATATITAAGSPGNWGWPLVAWSQGSAGVAVNEFTILKVATVLACCRYIATSVAQVDFNVYEQLPDGGKKYRPDDPLDWLLDQEANPETPALIFWETMILWVLIWGNAYAEIQRDYAGRVQWLWQLAPDRVRLRRNENTAEQEYVVRNDVGDETVIRRENMFHLRGLSWDGQIGYDIARLCREVFGGPLAAQEYANAFFGNDATPGFALTTPNSLSKPAIERLKNTHLNDHRGPSRSHAIAIFEEALMPIKLGANAEETQLVQVQQFYVEQVARVFGVPITKIGHMVHSGNRANMEEDDRAAYKQCLRPMACRIECEANIKLFGRVNRGQRFVLHDFSVLLRGNSEQMTNQTCQLLDRGVLKINEARETFDMNPISAADGGDTRPYPRNFTILEKAGEDPAPAAASKGGASGDAPGAGRSNNPPGTARATAMPAQVQATFQQLLEDAYARLLRVEADKAKRAGNKEQLGTHIVGYYTEDSARHVAATLQPVVAALLLALGHAATQADALATRFAEDHAVRSVAQLCDGTWQDSWANGRAKHEAEAHLQQLWEAVR